MFTFIFLNIELSITIQVIKLRLSVCVLKSVKISLEGSMI